MKSIILLFKVTGIITGKLAQLTIRLLLVLVIAIPFRLIAQTTDGGTTTASSTQTVKGRILDQESKQPIIGATVTIINGTEIKGAVTDAEGYFKIERVPLGRKTIKVTYMGYETIQLPDVMVTAGKEVILNLTMSESITGLKEAVITFNRKSDVTVTNNEMATVSSRSFNPDDTKKFAGALGDPSRMAANFAGVVAGNDSRNDIVVRGNSPNAMLWQMEGVNIPNPNHFGAGFNTGGPVSILNTNNIAKSDFFTSAFPAQYGNANGGVFDLSLREGNNEKREFLGQIGFNGFEVGAEGPFSKKSKASYLINYRYSTLAFMQDIGINPGTGAATPIYQDINFKISVPLKNKAKFIWWGMGGVSSIDLLGKEVDTTEVNFYGSRDEDTRPRYRSGVTGMSYEKNLGQKTWFKLTLAASQIHNRYTTDSIDLPGDRVYRRGQGSFTDNKFSLVSNFTHKINAKHAIHFGTSADLNQFDYFNKDVFNKGTVDTVRVNRKAEMLLIQGYVQWKYRISNRLTANTGVHLQYLDVNEQLVAEPRIGIRYVVSAKSIINIGYGLHHQTLPTYNIFLLDRAGKESNRDLKFMRSNHVVLGYEYSISKLWKVKTEVYYQYLDKVPVTRFPSSYSSLNIGASFVPSDEGDLVNEGTGYNYGAELTLERYFDKGFYALLTGSLFDSKYKGSDGIERNTAFNTNYALNFLAGKEFKLNKKGHVMYVNVRLTSVGGRYFSPLDLQQSQLQGRAVTNETLAFSEKQTDYFRADLKVGYRRDFKKSSLDFSLDLQNVTNNQNIFSQGYNKYTNTISYQYQQGFFPVPTIRYTF
jgi:hypothetical protein